MYTEIDGWRSIKNDICLKSAKKQGNGDINNYQNIELMTAMSYCAKWRTAVDVGAHVGITAFQMAKSFEHVHAFEINPKIYECPVYVTRFRGPTYVFLATLNCVDDTSRWTLGGVALVMQSDD